MLRDFTPSEKVEDVGYLLTIVQPILWLIMGGSLLLISVVGTVDPPSKERAFNAGMAILVGGSAGSFQNPTRKRPDGSSAQDDHRAIAVTPPPIAANPIRPDNPDA